MSTREDSVLPRKEGPDPGASGDGEAEQESRRPKASAFRQQRLPAWQPILSPKWVIPSFLIVGLVFIPVGIAVLVASNDVSEVKVRYDETCGDLRKDAKDRYVACNVTDIEVKVDEDIEKPVYMYYQLENFYQNHRRYVQSRDDLQLRGEKRSFDDVGDCKPFRSIGDRDDDASTGLDDVYAPCGLIAWSMFNDTFKIYDGSVTLCDTSNPTDDCKKDGIAWDSDKDEKFKSPSSSYTQMYDEKYDKESGHVIPKVKDEDFMVWMRSAALPTFRKLFRVINQKVPKGTYRLSVTDNFPVERFDGKKYLVLSNVKWTGGKNTFLGVAYIVVGAISFLLGIIFGIKQIVSPRDEEKLRRELNEMLHGQGE